MVRSFSGRAVSGETLEHILASSRRAPAAGNTDGWDAVVLQGPEQTDPFWQATTTAESREARVAGRGCLAHRWWSVSSRTPAPTSIATTSPTREAVDSGIARVKAAGRSWPVPFWFVDAGFVALIMLLSATDAGLGACFLGNFRGEADLCDVLGVPPGRRYLGAVLIGEPGGEDPPQPRFAGHDAQRKAGIPYGHW